MPFDGLAIAALCRELGPQLENQRIERIYQPEKDEIIISVRRRKDSRLLISANPRWARFHTTNERKENPAVPPGFCMLLRKHLEGGRIKAITQVDFERIVEIRVEALNDLLEWTDKVLVCEFMGKHSNIILLDPETGTIIDAIKRYSNEVSSYREVLPGKPYIAPPSQGKLHPLKASLEQVAERLWREPGRSLSQAIFAVYSGFSPFAARQVCHQAGLDPDLPAGECGEFEISTIFAACRSLVEQVTTGYARPTVLVSRQGEAVEFAPYTLIPDNRDSSTCIPFATTSQLVDSFFQEKLTRARMDSLKTNLLRLVKSHLDKSYRRRFLLEEDLAQARASEKFKLWGELLTAYAYQLKKGRAKVELHNYYTGEPVTIDLQPHLSPIDNAQRYFRAYNKAKASIYHASMRLRTTDDEIVYLESVAVALQQAETAIELDEIVEELGKEGYISEKTRRFCPSGERSKPRVFTSSDGIQILVGRNNRQNDQLTMRESDRNDLWLHAKDVAGSHVIIRLPKYVKDIHQVPDRTLEEAALLAAYYSKARGEEKVPVDYTFRQNVRKPKGAKPGRVLYENYWTIYVNSSDARLGRMVTPADQHP
ncbi:MAG: fibronectin/fibrinogen-binding protein [Syntrophomonadaceae bacterium]|nr:fibronectin/fibrinogen-binding protein [Syntrophomonadaceae bacterium]